MWTTILYYDDLVFPMSKVQPWPNVWPLIQ